MTHSESMALAIADSISAQVEDVIDTATADELIMKNIQRLENEIELKAALEEDIVEDAIALEPATPPSWLVEPTLTREQLGGAAECQS